MRELRRVRWPGMREPAHLVHADSSFFSRMERKLVNAPEGLVRRGTAGLSIDAELLLVQANHLPADVRPLSAEHPRRVLYISRATFRHYDEPVELRQ